MGTSTSRPKKEGQNPLVPSWADPSSPTTPQPAPDPGRFGPFKRALGRHASSQNGANNLQRSLKHYSLQASGGSANAIKRFAAAHGVGAALYTTLQDAKEGLPLELGNIEGESFDILIEVFSSFFSPTTGDSDKISAAIYDALSECLDGETEFNSYSLSDDLINQVFIKYNASIIFRQIIEDSGDAFEQAATPKDYIQKENDLRHLVETVVDLEMEKVLSQHTGRISNAELAKIQRDTIRNVWDIWGNYDN